MDLDLSARAHALHSPMDSQHTDKEEANCQAQVQAQSQSQSQSQSQTHGKKKRRRLLIPSVGNDDDDDLGIPSNIDVDLALPFPPQHATNVESPPPLSLNASPPISTVEAATKQMASLPPTANPVVSKGEWPGPSSSADDVPKVEEDGLCTKDERLSVKDEALSPKRVAELKEEDAERAICKDELPERDDAERAICKDELPERDDAQKAICKDELPERDDAQKAVCKDELPERDDAQKAICKDELPERDDAQKAICNDELPQKDEKDDVASRNHVLAPENEDVKKNIAANSVSEPRKKHGIELQKKKNVAVSRYEGEKKKNAVDAGRSVEGKNRRDRDSNCINSDSPDARLLKSEPRSRLVDNANKQKTVSHEKKSATPVTERKFEKKSASPVTKRKFEKKSVPPLNDKKFEERRLSEIRGLKRRRVGHENTMAEEKRSASPANNSMRKEFGVENDYLKILADEAHRRIIPHEGKEETKSRIGEDGFDDDDDGGSLKEYMRNGISRKSGDRVTPQKRAETSSIRKDKAQNTLSKAGNGTSDRKPSGTGFGLVKGDGLVQKREASSDSKDSYLRYERKKLRALSLNESEGEPVNEKAQTGKKTTRESREINRKTDSRKFARQNDSSAVAKPYGLVSKMRDEPIPLENRRSDIHGSSRNRAREPRLSKGHAVSKTPSSSAIQNQTKKGNTGEKAPVRKTKEAPRIGRTDLRKNLRDDLRKGLLDAGWSIDLRPRKNKNYEDNVYISPDGASFWSLPKAYEHLTASLAKDDKGKGKSRPIEVGHTKIIPVSNAEGEKIGLSNIESLIQGIGILKRKRRKKPGKEEDVDGSEGAVRKRKRGKKSKKKEQSHGGSNKVDSAEKNRMKIDYDGDDGRSYGPKSMSNVVRISSQGKKNKHRGGGYGLFVRGSGKGEKGDVNRCIAKRSVLMWLIDSGIISENESLQYWNKKGTTVMLEGRICRDGVLCDCCKDVISVSDFENHAGGTGNQLFENVYLSSGKSWTQCQLEAWDLQDDSRKSGNFIVEVDEDDQNDDTCGLCGDGGDLICCDKCPSTFHQGCLGLQTVPEGDWYCLNCICGICGKVGSIEGNEAIGDARFCKQCEHEFHETCLDASSVQQALAPSKSKDFCSQGCEKVSKGLQGLLGTKISLKGGFSWTLVKHFDEAQLNASSEQLSLAVMAECNAKLAVAYRVMDECFMPIIDPRSKVDMVSNVVYSCWSNFTRLNYKGFYTVILEKDDEFISVASIRVHGKRLAEMPLIGTRHHYRRQGMCRRLVNAVEGMLSQIKVEILLLPAIPELLHTWTSAFGFKPLEHSHKQEIRHMNLMVFPGTDLLQKEICERQSLANEITETIA